MMKKNLLLLLFFYNSVAFASSITLDGKEIECEKKKDVFDVFLCEKDGSKILVTTGGYGYSGFSKDSSGKFKIHNISKVVDGGKTLYEIPSLPGLGGAYGSGMYGNFELPDTLTNRKMMAIAITNTLRDFKDDYAKSLVKDANDFVKSIKKPSKVTFQTNDKSFDCEIGKSRELTAEEKKYSQAYNSKLGCDYYACKDKDGHSALAYVPEDGAFISPSILVLDPKGKEESHWLDISVKSADDENRGLTVFQSMKIPGGLGIGMGMGMGYPGGGIGSQAMASGYLGQSDSSTDKIEMTDYLPKKVKERAALFTTLAAPGAAETIQYTSSLCTDEKTTALFQKRNAIVTDLNDAILDENLTQLVSLMNGNLVGTLMPTNNISKYGCLYNGMVISPKAFAHLNYLKRLNEKPNEANYITLDQAQELFNKAKAMDDIPFGYKYDGCYARAHVMARRFEAMGIPTEKVWIKGDLSVPNTDIRWNFHVAPVVTVKDPKDGQAKKYVIDPSLTSKAVPLDEWVATMKPNVRGPVVKTSYPIPFNAAMMERTAVALSSSDPYLPDGDMRMTEDQKMEAARRTMVEYSKLVKKD